ncbi:PEP-CTERM protein-sorting domain-containing protein [Parasphingorhabdus marina DSM 22363]|uniref:PEP-CTERM protein-sorting domain-containing protein n=1 Tax=Parasphingorhabdus marina DSM 22363 TaxID=1123272 RepID=A0A1N6H0P7_9SPHN|nr:PEPxxWA-CTERM sorting domain-containing protein [Parasphingorhabdus marina]SIO13329.1 PEP-CTERM protein-sorting domain-containing protein [Parasphingorhabdus marina DSM 22363]
MLTKKMLLGAAVLATSVAPANAAIVLSQSDIGVLDPGEIVVCDGVSDCGGALTGDYINFSSTQGNAAALPGNSSSQIAVLGGDSATLLVNRLVSAVSFDWGSVDTYNTLNIFTTSGNFTVTGNDLPPANGNRIDQGTNFRFTATFDAPTFLQSLEFASSSNSFEFDNVGIAAVPEPATWAFMILGFGAIGGAMRRQRKANVKVSYA